MSERKVLNKYIPPDFDPSLIPRRRIPKNSQQVVRLMAPFSMRCNTCGEYIYKGKKFNARKETVEGEEYYGIKIFRFYIKCTLCSAEITFKTDPKNTDYVAEHGASRNFEPWRDEKEIEEDRITKLEEEENNPMKALENRTTDSKREMDILDALQDIRSRNARHERIGAALADDDGGLERIVRLKGEEEQEQEEDEETRQKRLEEEEDEKLVREVFSKLPASSTAGPSRSTAEAEPSSEPTITVKRKAGALPDKDNLLQPSTSSVTGASKPSEPPAKRKKTDLASTLGIKIKKKPVKSLV
ncbi:hypothetical protein FRB90_000282 [Tulasnella sp. 427]|nr:hypothetical protein FRB90_000282 [Tulasnella sp. 427]